MSERREPLAGKALDQYTRRLGFQMRLAQRASRKRKGLLDRLVTRLLDRGTRPKAPQDDFMRDEIVDAGIGFRPEELDAYQKAGSSEKGGE